MLDHLRAHANDVADLRIRQTSAAQVDHRRRAQAVQREAFQFGDHIACLGKLPAEFLARERLAILLQQIRTRSPLPCRHFRRERRHDRTPHIPLAFLRREREGIAPLISVDIGRPEPHDIGAAQTCVLVKQETAPHHASEVAGRRCKLLLGPRHVTFAGLRHVDAESEIDLGVAALASPL